jgi:hypothetical protein
MRNKHKILSILFVNRLEIENKWWHRMVNVFIFGSTILVAIFAISLFVSNSEMWKKYSYPAFSFENNYSSTKGKDVNCFIDFKPAGVSCGEYADEKGPYEAKYEVDLSDFIKRYNKAIKDEVGQSTIDKICSAGKALQADRNKLGVEGLDQKMLSCMSLTVDIAPIQLSDFPSNPNNQHLTYDEYLTEKQVSFLSWLWLNIKAKMITSIIYPILFQNLIYVILATLGWFIFCESIIYRTILYIIYGKRKEV